MATTFKIQYAASATPIESTQLTDTNNVATSVHSSIDKSVGGGKEISCSTTAANVAYKDYTTTATTTTYTTTTTTTSKPTTTPITTTTTTTTTTTI